MMTKQQLRPIGGTDVLASAIGLGTWAMGGWMWGGSDKKESVAAFRLRSTMV